MYREAPDQTAVALIHHLKGREKALEPFGLTGRRSEWIALASPHGGVFTRSQLSDWLGMDRFKTLRFVQFLKRRRLTAEETVGDLKVCRICARGIYRALGVEDVRLRRITATEVAMRRLLSFDYVIEHPDLPWLPTEAEKVAAFEALGIARSAMPVRVYRGAAGGVRRYFPRGMPVALEPRRAVFRPRRSRLRHLDGAPFVTEPAPAALGSAEGAAGLVGRSRRGRWRPEGTRTRTDDLGKQGRPGLDPRSRPGAQNRRSGPAPDRARRECHPGKGRSAGRGTGRPQRLPSPSRSR